MKQRLLFVCLGNICRSPAAEGIMQQLDSSYFDHFDLIIGMDHENIKAIRAKARNDADSRKIRLMADYLHRHPNQSTIPDPYYGTERDFELVIELLEDACEGPLDHLTA